MLDVECCVLDTVNRVPYAECQMSSAVCWVFRAAYCMSDGCCIVFRVLRIGCCE